MNTRIRYTRDLLVRTARISSSLVDLLTRLGSPLESRPLGYVRRRLEHYGIDTSHFVDETLPVREARRYTPELLAEAAANSTSIRGMFEYMGVNPGNGPYWHIRRRLDHFHIDTSHFAGGRRYPVAHPPREVLEPLVAASTSWAQVLRGLGRADSGAARARLRQAVTEIGLSTVHFTGRAHHRGIPSPRRRTASEILRRTEPGAPRVRTSHLRRALDDLQVPLRCSACGIGDTWQGRRLVLEIDHVNGDALDNRRENLRYVCPSCHSQTATHSRSRNSQPVK